MVGSISGKIEAGVFYDNHTTNDLNHFVVVLIRKAATCRVMCRILTTALVDTRTGENHLPVLTEGGSYRSVVVTNVDLPRFF